MSLTEKTSSAIRVLVLSAGETAGINFCNSLKQCSGKYYVLAAETNLYRLSYAVADERFLLPEPQYHEYWQTLLRLIDNVRPDFVYVADTTLELEMVSERREEITVPFFLPPKEAVRLYEDKWESYRCFKSANIAVPETLLVREPSDIDKAIREFGSIWLRATHGSAGRGSLPTDDPVLAKAWVERYKGWGRFTAAELLTRKMATWTGLWLDGELVVCQGRKRSHWEHAESSPSGVSGITGAQSTTSDRVLHETALATIHSTPYAPHGIVSVDVTYDSKGRPNPTEIQASRFYSSIYFLTKAGLNLPDLYVQTGLSNTLIPLEKREHPLKDDLVWLKAIDCMPILTDQKTLEENQVRYTVV